MREWSKIKVFDNFGDNCFIIISRSSISLPEKKKIKYKKRTCFKSIRDFKTRYVLAITYVSTSFNSNRAGLFEGSFF